MTFDKVIKGGMIIDGRNFPRYRADIGTRTAASTRSAGSPARTAPR
jgi:hypothetical protein